MARKYLTDIELREEILRNFELGNTAKTELYGIINTTFRLGRDRYFKAYEECLSHWKDLKNKAIDSAIEDSTKDKINGAIMTADERKIELTNIAKGNTVIPIKKPFWNPKKKKFDILDIEEIPNHGARIRAIEELNRMEGDYAPKAVDLSSKGKELKNLTEPKKAKITLKLT